MPFEMDLMSQQSKKFDPAFDQKSVLFRFQNNLVQNFLFKKSPRILIACSGGADSVALFHLVRLSRPHLKVALIHFNHGIRAKTAKRDELFVKKLAMKYKVPFFVGRAQLSKKSNRNKLSLEEAARARRYEFLKKIYKQWRGSAVFFAHHMDDQAETVMMRVCQGTGLRGLLAIREDMDMNGMRVVRPMLPFLKQEILSFLKENQILFCQDETNRCIDYLRNCVRIEVLPFLKKKMNPRLIEALARMPQIMGAENGLIEEFEKKAVAEVIQFASSSRVILKANIFKSLHPALQFRVLDRCLKKIDPDAGMLFEHTAILRNQLRKSNIRISLPRKLEISGNLRQLFIQRNSKSTSQK